MKRIKRKYTKRVSIDETVFSVMEATVSEIGYTRASFATLAIEEKLLRSGYAKRFDESTQQNIWFKIETV